MLPELPVWSRVNLTTPSFVQPTSRRISSTCTPRACNDFEVPVFDVGTKDNPNWIKINKFGTINKAEVLGISFHYPKTRMIKSFFDKQAFSAHNKNGSFKSWHLLKTHVSLSLPKLFIKCFLRQAWIQWATLLNHHHSQPRTSLMANCSRCSFRGPCHYYTCCQDGCS